jgi:hypothetical protein
MAGLLKRLFQAAKKSTDFPLHAEHRIKHAFTIKGVEYFEFDDAFNVPASRMFAAMSYYQELQMRCTREYLLAHCAAFKNVINSKQIDLTKLMRLNMQMEERLELILDHEILYKLASVIYFDKTENPYTFDFKYSLEKMKIWKEEKAYDFFLLQPLQKYIPLKDLSEDDLRNSMMVVNLMTQEHLENISTMLSENDKSKEFYKILDLAKNLVKN